MNRCKTPARWLTAMAASPAKVSSEQTNHRSEVHRVGLQPLLRGWGIDEVCDHFLDWAQGGEAWKMWPLI